MKTRHYVVASSLGTYFGLYQSYGTSPLDQLEIDLGNEEASFDDAAIDRMDLGKDLEDAVLDYFERKLNIKISERNTETIYAFDDLVKCKIDGDSIYEGLPTGIECKVSNAATPFTENIGYIMQCQTYMNAKGYDRWLLLGLWNGKPLMKLIHRDEQMQQDIQEMAENVVNILNGILSKDDFAWHLVEKYSNIKKPEIMNLSKDDETLLNEYVSLKEELYKVKAIEDRVKEIENYLKESYVGVYQDNGIKLSITESKRKGTIDLQMLAIDHPNLDIEKYRSQDTITTTLRFKKAE